MSSAEAGAGALERSGATSIDVAFERSTDVYELSKLNNSVSQFSRVAEEMGLKVFKNRASITDVTTPSIICRNLM